MASSKASANVRGRVGNDCDLTNLGAAASKVQAQQGSAGDAALRKQRDASPINQRGGHSVFTFDLSDARFASGGAIEYTAQGQSVTYSVQNSAPGGVLDFDFDAGGQQLGAMPGSVLKGNFARFNVRLNPLSMLSGQVTLRVSSQPDVQFVELAQSGGQLGNPNNNGIGPAGAVVQAAVANEGENIPTAATDGVSLVGVSGVRAVVGNVGGINGATLQWWQLYTASNGLSAWVQTDTVDVYGAASHQGAVLWMPSEHQIFVPQGRIYAELIGNIANAGTVPWIVALQTWGKL